MKRTALKRKTPLARTSFVVKKSVPKKKSKVKSQAKYKKELDAVFSRFIRYRDDGQCFTCPNKQHPKKMQNGHFVPRQYLTVRWDERNCNCQCYACNMLYGGQGATYAIRLAQKYGQDTVDYLESQRWVSVKLDIPWYIEQIAIYTKLVEKYDNRGNEGSEEYP